MIEPSLAKGEEVFLDIRDSARRRVICGLRWDPLKDNSEALDRDLVAMGGETNAHDLDLLCVSFDKRGNFIEAVTGVEGQNRGDSGNIYHTGDVVDGDDELDDEQLHLELFNLSTDIHQIFFIAEVQSAHNFGMIDSPEIRLGGALSDTNFAHTYLGRNGGDNMNSFLFGCIYRVSQGWNFRYLGEYYNIHEIDCWETHLEQFVERPKGADGRIIKGPPSPKKGEGVPLFVSPSARQRIVCGLNWDPLSEDQVHMENLKAQNKDISGFDLDLACVMYNEDGEAVDGVSAQPDENMDSSGHVYHSGDDTSGEGDRTDDESISIELKDFPEHIKHVVFVAEIQTGHTFEDIINPSMRIADGKTNDSQLKTRMRDDAAHGKNGYIFARITRHQGKWLLHNIHEYFVSGEVEDLIEHMKQYLA